MHKLNEYLLDLSPEFLVEYINSKSITKVEFEKVVLTSVDKRDGIYYHELTIAPAEGSGYINEKKIAYTKIGLEIVARTFGHVVIVDFDTTSIHTALPSIAKRYGIYIDPKEVVDAPVEFTNDEASVSIAASATALCVYGEVTVTFKRAKPALKNIITSGTLPQPTMYRETTWKNPLTETRYYTGDYTSIESTLRTYSKGSTIDSTLENAINAVSKRARLQIAAQPDPDIFGSKILYNGPIATKPDGIPTRDGFANVLVTADDSNSASPESVQYIIHYGHLEKDA